jgi:NitT/TauT family transport system permease protein
MSFVSSIIEFPRRVRFADIIVLLGLGGLIYFVYLVTREWRAHLLPVVVIDTKLSSLPLYTVYSLSRGLAAYLISLVFTFVYGYVMAHSEKAEKIMLPVLDILQSIPVLTFLPGFVLALATLFPRTNTGLELVAVMAIFTGQVWNMTYAFYRSLKVIPTDMRDAARSFYLSRGEVIRKLELPASTIPLVWNSMMSMAGGWFFLTVCEAFTIGNKDFRLPGIGSYMSVAIERGDVTAMIGAVVAMAVMIVALDRLLWHPLVVWSTKFRMEENSNEPTERSIVLEVVSESWLVKWFSRILSKRREKRPEKRASKQLLDAKRISATTISTVFGKQNSPRRKYSGWILVSVIVLLIAYGVVSFLLTLAKEIGSDELRSIGVGTMATLARTFAAVVIGAAWTVPVGAMIGMNPKLSRRMQPIIQFLASFPAPMLFPLVLLVLTRFGITIEIGAVLLMLMGTQWYLLFNVIAGASAIPNEFMEVSSNYRLPRLLRWKKVILPALFPSIVTGAITAAGGAWNASIVAENYAVPGKAAVAATGIGALISKATDEGNYALLIASTLALCVVIILLNRFFWHKLFALAQDRYSLNK